MDLQIQTTQNPHTQATTSLSTNVHGFGDIKAYLQHHVSVKVPQADILRFYGKKDWPTQNVFVACDFDMKFTYVLSRWEGTTSDSRILKDEFVQEDPLVIPEG